MRSRRREPQAQLGRGACLTRPVPWSRRVARAQETPAGRGWRRRVAHAQSDAHGCCSVRSSRGVRRACFHPDSLRPPLPGPCSGQARRACIARPQRSGGCAPPALMATLRVCRPHEARTELSDCLLPGRPTATAAGHGPAHLPLGVPLALPPLPQLRLRTQGTVKASTSSPQPQLTLPALSFTRWRWRKTSSSDCPAWASAR